MAIGEHDKIKLGGTVVFVCKKVNMPWEGMRNRHNNYDFMLNFQLGLKLVLW